MYKVKSSYLIKGNMIDFKLNQLKCLLLLLRLSLLLFLLTSVVFTAQSEDGQKMRPIMLERNNSSSYEDFPEEIIVNLNKSSPSTTKTTSARQFHLGRLPSSEVIAAAASREPVEMVVPPYEDYNMNNQQGDEVSYVFDRKRFIDSAPIRCMTSTFIENPYAFEPGFAIITARNEVRLNATAPAQQILFAGFDPRKKTTIVVHGYSQSYPDTVWLRRTRALFETNNFVNKQNLIIMDYGIASKQSYAQVAAMASGMGAFLANFIMKLYELGQNPMDIHLVAHSLGSHVAGFAGKRLRPKIGRITALDPAGPCFGKILYNHEQDRLTSQDAYMVDVLHYDDDFLGLPGQVGQFDVYVNGGHTQPGCGSNANTMFQAMVTMVFRRKRVLSESHTRSTEVASTRLTNVNCQQVAYECRSYEAFLAGECGRCDEQNNQCYFMEMDYQDAELPELPLRQSNKGKKFFISTGSGEPFCLQHYQILVKFQPSPEMSQQAKSNRWQIEMEALDEFGNKFSKFTLSNQMAPNVFSYLYQTQPFAQPLKIESARLQIKQANGKPVSLSTNNNKQPPSGEGAHQLAFEISNVEVNFMSNINPQIRQAMSSRLCVVGVAANDPNSIDTDGWIHLSECIGV